MNPVSDVSSPADRTAADDRRGHRCIATGAVFALLAVAAGAFGAHALRPRLAPEALAVFETAARYQMYHALALVACGLGPRRSNPRPVAWAAALFVAGIVLFSGSLYLLALTGWRALGMVTPLGGAAWLVGWAALAIAALRADAGSSAGGPH
jgi:uncharacterized membrane protein YgdD (TMEM256/DUF423 family)